MERRQKNNPIELVFIVFLFLIISTKPVYAYLDPGTGSFILQILAASALGALFAIKTFWRSIISFFRGIFSKKNKTDTSKKKGNVKK
jgi:hypothetical protein